MKAVIMAGGEGTRLRPLTCDCPKPMARIVGRPILEYILDLLQQAGITEAAVTLKYLPRKITGAFPNSEYHGIRLRFFEEDKPLGTAGSVRNASGFLDEDFVVISGDALCDFDLKAAFEFHREKKSAATLLLSHVADPREYGLVVTSPSGAIRGFVEKPGWAQAVTDAVNTGIYIIHPDVLQLIPEGKNYDFAKDLFPLMLSRSMPVYGFEADGYWCDIGDIGAYTSCQFDALEGRVVCGLPGSKKDGVVSKTQPPAGNFRLIPPVYIGEGVKIGDYSIIGPNAVIDDGCTLGNSVTMKDSILLPNALVGDRSELRGALVCPGASLERGAGMFEGSVAGSNSVIGRDAAVSPGVRIWPGKRVEDGARASRNLKSGVARRGIFDDEGISGEVGVELTPEFCAKIGAAAGGTFEGARVGVGDDGSNVGRSLKNAVSSGILSAGGQVCDFSSSFEAMFAFAVSFCGLDMGIFTRAAGSRAVLKIVGKNGLTVGRQTERKMETAVNTGEISRCAPRKYGEPSNMSGIRVIYQKQLLGGAAGGLSGIDVTVHSPNRAVQKLMAETLAILGAGSANSGGLRLHITAAGNDASFYDENGDYLDPGRTLALGCLIAFENGEDVALPYEAPRTVDAIADRYSRKVIRYLDCPADASDHDARILAAKQPWLRDGLMGAVRILDYLKKKNSRLCDAVHDIPGFAVSVKAVKIIGNPGNLLRSYAQKAEKSEGPSEGVSIRSGRGHVLLSPLKQGGGLRILAEAADMEAAEELCADYEKRIRDDPRA
ncbi:MAG TPA: sugar phosphate nucleotidyltransferase [Clostridia bacterium]|nr:sugar phosphate nucleotidyltransferase [Clostridia bacterium]